MTGNEGTKGGRQDRERIKKIWYCIGRRRGSLEERGKSGRKKERRKERKTVYLSYSR